MERARSLAVTSLIAFGFFVVLSTLVTLAGLTGLALGLANLGALVAAIVLARVVRS